MKKAILCISLLSVAGLCAADSETNVVADLGTVVVEGGALSRYRPETVNGATFTDLPPELSPTVVARESWGLRSSHCRAEETSPRRVSRT